MTTDGSDLSQVMPLPNFLVIGTGRSGTTSLHYYLAQHPDVFIPAVKAPSFFFCCDRPATNDPYLDLVTRNYFVSDYEEYLALFSDVRKESAIGEVSPVYLATTVAAPRIAEKIPEARLLAIIRNPVDRAYARFLGRKRDGLERRSFAQIVKEEEREGLLRDDASGTYLASGFTYHFLTSYLDLFPRERFAIQLFEDLQDDPRQLVVSFFEFLGVDSRFRPSVEKRYNQSGGEIQNPAVRYLWTHSALLRARARRFLPRTLRDAAFNLVSKEQTNQPLDPEMRAYLTGVYREDVLELQDWLDRDLSDWLS